jgi:hypothetical protein
LHEVKERPAQAQTRLERVVQGSRPKGQAGADELCRARVVEGFVLTEPSGVNAGRLGPQDRAVVTDNVVEILQGADRPHAVSLPLKAFDDGLDGMPRRRLSVVEVRTLRDSDDRPPGRDG